MSTTSGRWAHGDASLFRTPPLVAPHPPGRPTATEATVRTGAFVHVFSTGPTRAVPSTGLHRTASAEWTTANGVVFGCPSASPTGHTAHDGGFPRRSYNLARPHPPPRRLDTARLREGSRISRLILYAIGLPPCTTPEGLILAVLRPCLPLDPALKGEACARNSRRSGIENCYGSPGTYRASMARRRSSTDPTRRERPTPTDEGG